MFNQGDIIKARLLDNKTAHYLILDDTQNTWYTLLCLDSGGTRNRLKSWVDHFSVKVA
jgi:hypothetical protein